MAMTFKERRDILADFLEFEVQPRLNGAKFDMRGWGHVDDDHAMPPRSNSFKRLSECGFAGCAAGWGAFCPALKKEGIPVERCSGILYTTFSQLAAFFGLGEAATEKVFSPDEYPDEEPVTIPMVVKRLRAAVDAKE